MEFDPYLTLSTTQWYIRLGRQFSVSVIRARLWSHNFRYLPDIEPRLCVRYVLNYHINRYVYLIALNNLVFQARCAQLLVHYALLRGYQKILMSFLIDLKEKNTWLIHTYNGSNARRIL